MIHTACTELGVLPEKLVRMSRDRVLVNGAANRPLQQCVLFCAERQLRIAHTLNNVGCRFDFQVLSNVRLVEVVKLGSIPIFVLSDYLSFNHLNVIEK